MYCIILLVSGLDVVIVTSFLTTRAPWNSACSYGWQGAATAYLRMAGQCYTCLKNVLWWEYSVYQNVMLGRLPF